MTCQNIVFPDDCKAITDVTKPPYNLDNTGRIDCTKQLVQIIDDIIAKDLEAFEKTRCKLEAMPDPNAQISFEVRKVQGQMNVIFAENLPESKIIYFPNGTYLVSDTISYSYENLTNILEDVRKYEMNRCIHFRGQSCEGVKIRLKDNCHGFEAGMHRPVISFMRGEASNIAMTNTFENITIDIGKDNPGAVGLVFFGNNTGAVRNVRIISSDPEHRGSTGLAVIHEIVSGCFVKNLEVVGFDYGIKVTPSRNFTAFEHITVKNQRKAGFYIYNTITSIRGLYSENTLPALRIAGPTAHVVLADGKLHGGNANHAAIEYDMGTLFARNVDTAGYKCSVAYASYPAYPSNYIEEYCSHEAYSLSAMKEKKSLSLPIEDPPDIPWENDFSKWASVNNFGAKGDGITDDTDAIQLAMNSGYPVIYFQPGKYLVDGIITIPATVDRINFMYCDLIAGNNLKNMKNNGTFTITGDSPIPLIMEDLFAWEKFHGHMHLIHHASKRTLVLSDLHTQTCAMYFNSVPGGKVFIENAACTIGGDPYKDIPCFLFRGQTVWARHINPERSLHEVVNEGSALWVLGFKTEGPGTAYETTRNGSTEVLGGVLSIGTNKQYPAIINDHSNVSIILSTNGYAVDHIFPVAVEERHNGKIGRLKHDVFPRRLVSQYIVPLYVSYQE